MGDTSIYHQNRFKIFEFWYLIKTKTRSQILAKNCNCTLMKWTGKVPFSSFLHVSWTSRHSRPFLRCLLLQSVWLCENILSMFLPFSLLPSRLRDYGLVSFCRLLNKLHERSFYKRLQLEEFYNWFESIEWSAPAIAKCRKNHNLRARIYLKRKESFKWNCDY